MSSEQEKDSLVELPPSEAWSPAQALAAAARAPFAEVVVIGFRDDGELVILHSRMRSEHMLWLADELRDYARATGGPLRET